MNGIKRYIRYMLDQRSADQFVRDSAEMGRDAGDAVEKGANKGVEKFDRDTRATTRRLKTFFVGQMKAMAATVAVAFGASAVASQLREAYAATDRLTRSNLKLESSAKIAGVELARVKGIAATAKREFGLAASTSNELAVSITRLTTQAGVLGQSEDVLASFLEVGAARGYDAEQTMQALGQAILGIDEGTDKLFGRNPSALWKEYANEVGTTVGAMGDQEKALALVRAGLKDAGQVQGAYADLLETTAGKQAIANARLEDARARVGGLLAPLREVTADALLGFTQGVEANAGTLRVLGKVLGWVAIYGFKFFGALVLNTVDSVRLVWHGFVVGMVGGFSHIASGAMDAAIAIAQFADLIGADGLKGRALAVANRLGGFVERTRNIARSNAGDMKDAYAALRDRGLDLGAGAPAAAPTGRTITATLPTLAGAPPAGAPPAAGGGGGGGGGGRSGATASRDNAMRRLARDIASEMRGETHATFGGVAAGASAIDALLYGDGEPARWGIPDPTQIAADMDATLSEAIGQTIAEMQQQPWFQMREAFRHNIADALVGGLEDGFMALFTSGSIGAGFGQLAASLVGGLGGAMVEFGKASLIASALMEKIKTALANFLPGGGIVAAGLMIAAGKAMQALASSASQSFGGSMRGGAGGYAGGSFGGSGVGARDRAQPETHIYIDQFDPDNPAHVEIVGRTVNKGQERGVVKVHPLADARTTGRRTSPRRAA